MAKNIFFLITVVSCCLMSRLQANAQQLSVDQVLIPVISLDDQKLIHFFLEEFMILASDTVAEMQIIDATGNGFGEDDLIKLIPSNEIFFPGPSDTAQKIMNDWEFTANFRKDAINESPEHFESLPTKKAENSIFASLLRGLDYNFHDLPIKIRFERDSSGVATFEMWGYDETKLRFTPPPSPLPDSVETFDILHVFRSDTLYITDTTYFDLIHVYKTVTDTVFLFPPNY